MVISGFSKLMLAYLMIFFVLIMLPVLLLTTSDLSIFDSIVNYIFKNNLTK